MHSDTITECLNCDTDIRGEYIVPGFFGGSDYKSPNYCHECGDPYPWTEQIINNAVELVGLDDDLDSEAKQIIKSTFKDLLIESPTTPVAIAKYKKYIDRSQAFIKDGLRSLFIDVVSETVRKGIWG